MNAKLFPLAACALLGLSGCLSIETAPVHGGGEHVVMTAYGWQLFGFIPLWCGNVEDADATGCVFFRDDVTAEKLQRRMTAYAKGRPVECPVFHLADEMAMSLFGIPLPGIYTYREISLSGTIR